MDSSKRLVLSGLKLKNLGEFKIEQPPVDYIKKEILTGWTN